jgi:hypothetical protein
MDHQSGDRKVMRNVAEKSRTNKKATPASAKAHALELLEAAAEASDGANDSASVVLAAEDARNWRDWLDANDRFLLDLFEAVEDLATQSNAGIRMLRNRNDEPGTRYDEVEEDRNRALHALQMIRGTERAVRDELQDAMLKQGGAT